MQNIRNVFHTLILSSSLFFFCILYIYIYIFVILEDACSNSVEEEDGEA